MAVGNDTPLPSTGSSAQSDSGDEIVAATPLTLQKRQQADLTKLVSALGDFFFFKNQREAEVKRILSCNCAKTISRLSQALLTSV